MFKQVISALGDSVKSAGKNFGRSMEPSELASDKLTGIISAGLSGIGTRSPLLSDITSAINDKFLATVALEKERNKQFQDFMRSETGISAGKEATKSEPLLSQKKIDSQMMGVLSKITRLIDRSGEEEAKKTDLYKKYETYYTEFKKTVDAEAKKKSEVNPTEKTTAPKESGGSDQLLVDIETNTKNTADALAKGGTGGKEPVTIRGAAQHIGGTFLNKVFNEDMISRMASATTAPFTKFGGTGTGNLDTKGSYIAHDTSLQAKVKAEGLNEESTLESNKQKETADDGLLHSNEGILANTDKILEYLEKQKAEKEKITQGIAAKKETPGILDNLLEKYTTGKLSEAAKEAKKETPGTTLEKQTTGKLYEAAKETTGTTLEKQSSDVLKQIEQQLTKSVIKSESKKETPNTLDDLLEKYTTGKSSEASKEAESASAKRDAADLALEKQSSDTLKRIEEQLTKGAAKPEAGKTLIERTIGGLTDLIGKRIPGLGSVLTKGASIAGTVARGAGGLIARSGTAIGGATAKLPGLISTAGSAVGKAASTGLSGALNIAKTGASYLPAVGSAAKLAASGGIMMAGGAAVDSALGAMGVGGNEIDVAQDDKNWERASIWEKIQSAPARGIEKLGGSVFLDNIANEARQKRITSETEYLDTKEGKSKAPTSTSSKERDLRFQEELDDANSDNTITPEWKKNYAERLDSLEKRGISIDSAKMIARMDASNDTPKHTARTADQTGAATKSALESQKKTPGTEVERLTAAKDTQTAAQTAKAAQPIVINNTTAAQSQPAAAPVIAITPSIRNQDSTFERTQMKDFWARTF